MPRTVCAFIAAALLVAAPLPGQQEPYDSTRANIPETAPFDPLFVEGTVPLRDALQSGRLQISSPLIVLEHHTGWRLALSMEQMAYHHAAQGEQAGEPWMVSF